MAGAAVMAWAGVLASAGGADAQSAGGGAPAPAAGDVQVPVDASRPLTVRVAQRVLVEAEEETPLLVIVGPARAIPARSYLQIRGLPDDARLNVGHTIAPGVWAVPLASLATLTVSVPEPLPGPVAFTVRLISLQGAVLVEATSELIVASHEAFERAAAAETDAVPRLLRPPTPAVQVQPPGQNTGQKTGQGPGPDQGLGERRNQEPAGASAAGPAPVLVEGSAEGDAAQEPAEARLAEMPPLAEDTARLLEQAPPARVSPGATPPPAPSAGRTALRASTLAPAASPQASQPAALPPSSPTIPEPPAPAASTAPLATGPQLSAQEAAQAQRFLDRGMSYMLAGNVAAARGFFRRAAGIGLAQGAVMLGATYDPSELRSIGAQGLEADPGEAIRWYEKARELGAPGMDLRLARLGAGQ